MLRARAAEKTEMSKQMAAVSQGGEEAEMLREQVFPDH